MAETTVGTPLQDSLKDIVLGVLSFAAAKGFPRIRITEFYNAFADIVEAHREMFPPMLFTKGSRTAYSKRLDDALQSLIGFSVALPNPQLQYLQVEPDTATRQVAWLKDKYGPEAINALESLTGEFLNNLKAGQK